MTPTPQPSATPSNPSSQVVDRLFRRWVSDPNNNGEYILSLSPVETEVFFFDLGVEVDALVTENARLRAELESHRDQWKLSSVCREKEAEIVRLREEVSALKKDARTIPILAKDHLTLQKDMSNLDGRLETVLDQLAAVTREREELKRTLGNTREHLFVDASPDGDLPKRILAAYIDETEAVTDPPALGELMNKWQAERNQIIKDALAILDAARKGKP